MDEDQPTQPGAGPPAERAAILADLAEVAGLVDLANLGFDEAAAVARTRVQQARTRRLKARAARISDELRRLNDRIERRDLTAGEVLAEVDRILGR